MLSENIDNINDDYIIICDPIKNSIIQHSNFYKIIYSNPGYSTNGLFILIELKKINILKEKLYFDKYENTENIQKIINIEKYLINMVNDNNKKKSYKICELLNNNNIKYSFSEYYNSKIMDDINYKLDNKSIILKISGIWETKDTIGLTFKFILIDKVLKFNHQLKKMPI